MDDHVDVIITGTGTDTLRAATDAGALCGVKSSQKIPSGFEINFVDYPFTESRPRPKRHLRVVEQLQPKYAVAPDVDGRVWPLDRAVEFADRLDEHAETVIVVPKAVDPREIPDRFRVGLPFQPNYGPGGLEIDDLLPDQQLSLADFNEAQPWEQYADVGPVHVLGGSPSDQLRIRDETPIEVGSVDGSNPSIYARNRRVWFTAGQLDTPRLRYKRTLQWSLMNMLDAWNPNSTDLHPLLQRMNRDMRSVIVDYRYYLAGRPGTSVGQYMTAPGSMPPPELIEALDRLDAMNLDRHL